MNYSAGHTVVLSDSEPPNCLAGRLMPQGRSPEWYRTLEDLLRARPLATISALVVNSHTLPTGMLLLVLGRMAMEYPAMHKTVLMDAAPPLPIAEYLASCGVDMVWSESGIDTIERLAAEGA